jgi:hypothetical protein
MHRAAAEDDSSRAIAAYDRACHAIQLSKYGQASAPVRQLSDTALSMLFAPQAYDKLIAVNFYNPPPSCRPQHSQRQNQGQNQKQNRDSATGVPDESNVPVGKSVSASKRGK